MIKAAWVLAGSLLSAGPAFADPQVRAVAVAPSPPKTRLAVSPILNANTREIMMPGKGMPKKRSPRAR